MKTIDSMTSPAQTMQGRQIEMRPFEPTDADYRARARIYSSRWPDQQATPEELRSYDMVRPADANWEMWMLVDGGDPSGYVSVVDAFWSEREGQVSVSFELTPDLCGTDVERQLLKFGIERALLRDPRSMGFGAQSRDPFRIEMLEALGAKIEMRQLFSGLDVLAFEPAPYKDLTERLSAAGVRILSVAILAAEDAEWKRRLYDLFSTVIVDVPVPGGVKPEPYEEFLRWVEAPELFNLAGCFVAEADGRLVGLTMLDAHKCISGRYETGLTGVLREHRRTGLATALKATAIAWAKGRGCTYIQADNAAQNPMYTLNRKLGFTDRFEMLLMLKERDA